MNGGPAQQSAIGHVTRVDCSGIGPNSGEITIVLRAENGEQAEVFAGIMSNPQHPTGIENGVYAAYKSMALAAMTSGRLLKVNFLQFDKPRINGMTILGSSSL